MQKKFPEFSHLDAKGNVKMVDVSKKKSSLRFARASALIHLRPKTLELLVGETFCGFPKRSGRAQRPASTLKKGDAFATAKIAGILAAKRVHELIPLAHPLPITHCEISFETLTNRLITSPTNADIRVFQRGNQRESALLKITAIVKTKAGTGVEMEALTAVAVAALTIYDMVKAVERGAVIEKIQLEEKWGGKSGHFIRKQ